MRQLNFMNLLIASKYRMQADYMEKQGQNFPNENDYRNPALAEAAKNLGFINAFNVGVKAAIAALKKNGNPSPEFIKINLLHFWLKDLKRDEDDYFF